MSASPGQAAAETAESGTVRHRCEGSTDLGALFRVESAQPSGQQGPADWLQVVERRNTVRRKALGLAKSNLGRYPSNGSSDRCDKNGVQDGNCFTSGHDENRSTLVFRLGPPDLALLRRHQGSSAIIAIVDPSLQASSLSV